MTRKDYELIAAAIQNDVLYTEHNPLLLRPDIQMTGIRRIVASLCITFQNDNPNFDQGRFIAACGLKD